MSLRVMANETPLDSSSRRPVDSSATTVSGPTGGLTLPYGSSLGDGTMLFGYNNVYDVRYAGAQRSDNYLIGVGILPHVELTGRLANFSTSKERSWTGFLARDLSANVKLSLPSLFRAQPDIAVGINDLGGGAALFRSKYVTATESFGRLRTTLGKASGEAYLNGFFAGAELAVGDSGLSVLAERNGHSNYGGLRYASSPIAALANASIVVTAQRSYGVRTPDGNNFDRSTVGINVVMPFGSNTQTRTSQSADAVPASALRVAQRAAVPAQPAVTAPSLSSAPAVAPLESPAATEQQSLRRLQLALEAVGLERVRVGLVADKVVVEYENHRYNHNEADAIGIALGLAAKLAPDAVTLVSVITKRSGLVLYETRIDRLNYQRFLRDNALWAVRDVLEFTRRPAPDATVRWLDAAEGSHGYSRVLVEPVLKSFVGTEVGLYDYSLAANVQATVPLWSGAELNTSSIENLKDSPNVRDGVFSYARLNSGLRSASVNQALWITDRLLNVISAGKYQYDYTGIQNDATFFVPGREDQVKFKYTRISHSDRYSSSTLVNMSGSYRWSYQPLDLWVEAGYSQYSGNDRGPTLRLSRWFGDVQAQVYMRRSELATIAGFQLAFPLTPRQGMKSGYIHIEGPAQYAYGLETKLAGQGGTNNITRGVAEEIPIVYAADKFLLNQGRVGKDYLITQLPRMREAFLLYVALD